MDDSRIDLSSLDPKRDPLRFEQRVQAVMTAARIPASNVHWLALDLVQRGRLAVAAAAVLAIISWLPNVARHGSDAAATAAIAAADPVELISTWAYAGKVPSDVDPLQALGALHDR